MMTNRLVVVLILLAGLFMGCVSSPETPLSPRTTRNANGSITIDIAGMPVQGAAEAKVAVMEFSDYECPYCARNATTVFPEVRDRFVSTGKVRYVFANFPLPNHRNAESLAAAAICAGKQDAYWKMHDQLFANRPKTTQDIFDLGRQMGLQIPPFEQCLGEDGPTTERIRIDQQIAREFQISGTPSFILGVFDAQGGFIAQDLIVGAHPFPVFETALTKLLSK